MARTLCRIVFLFMLAVLLAAPWSAADAPRATGESSPHLFGPAWSWLSALWKETGCIIDPSGLCGSAPENLDTGCGIDPSGLCRSAPEPLETGCGLDPSGVCGQ